MAIAEGSDRLSRGELAAASAVLARDLSGSGLADGAVVAMVARRAAELAIALRAADAVDASLLVLDASAPPAELERVLRDQDALAFVEPGRPGLAVRRMGDAPAEREPIPGGLLLRTSGVTGDPKVARRPWPVVRRNAEAFAEALALRPDDVVMSTSALHHSYAVNAGMLTALAAGATFNAPALPATPARLAAAIDGGGGSVVMSVPALWRLYAVGNGPQPRLAISAGESLPRDVYDAWLARHERPVCEHYGTTEFGQVAFDLDGHPGSVGHAVPGMAVEVSGADGANPGRVLVRDTASDAGLQDTGDLGRLAADGRLSLEGRASERIKVNGATVPLREVEATIAGLPEVHACACVVRDAGEGQQLWAYLEMDGPLDEPGLRRRLMQDLAPHKVPTVLRPVPSLPRTASGKIARGALTGG